MASLQATTGSLEDWVSSQRWYAGKGSAPRLREIASWRLAGDTDTEARIALLLDESTTPAELYQVPLTVRSHPLAGQDSALIGTVGRENGPDRFLYDGMHDPLFARQLLELIVHADRMEGDGASATGVPLGELELSETTSAVLEGEQSNTSVVFRFDRGDAADGGPHAVVCKLFRILHAGVNPDVELQSALTAAGSLRVPETIGSVVGQWPGTATPETDASGHLAFAQVFVEGARDAWSLALAAARDGRDFSTLAGEIGRAASDVHGTLASSLHTKPPSATEISEIETRWHRRLTAAIKEIPAIADFEQAIAHVYDSAAHTEWPDLQRVHGDLHLGQALITPDGKCVIIDFEGEPIRTIAERAKPDVVLRDVAGMLRSFDYVRGALTDAPGIVDWTKNARGAFLDGYTSARSDACLTHPSLLDAFEMDKAVYEAVYESRHRPTWLRIPMEAIARLSARGAAETKR